jgi:uncharacterized membrane protein
LIDKALIIVFAFYAMGFMFVGLEYSMGQVYHVEVVSPLTGEPIKTSIVGYLSNAEFNAQTENIVTANYTTNSTFFDKVETFTTGAAYVAWELIGLMTGTFIFNIMILMGVPVWFVTAFVALYILLLSRAIIGYVRGI